MAPTSPIDLRSDTVTLPTPAMRRAMAEAELGDDVFGEDPTVIRLEELAAKRTGKEAGLFVASGTMGNLVCLLTHCGRGDEAIVPEDSHHYNMEQGGMAALGGIVPRPLPTLADGGYAVENVRSALRPDDPHFARTRLLCLENSHNRRGGAVLTPARTRELADAAHSLGLSVHLDGARVFNAAVALGVPVTHLTGPADSLSFCLSKGLACPVGSVVCGSADFVAQARRNRKVLGGGMRQAGVLAAAGIVALNEMVDRLAEDHWNARILGDGLIQLPGVTLDLETVQTNIVVFDFEHPRLSPQPFVSEIGRRGVLMFAIGGKRIRAVTHYGITEDDVRSALGVMRRVLSEAA